MKRNNLVLVMICLVAVHLCIVSNYSYAQDKRGEAPNEEIIGAVDISHDLLSRLDRWGKNEIVAIMICPRVISPDEDPFALPGEKKKLSVLGFGRLEKEDANSLVAAFDEKLLRVPKLTGGYYAELYFLFSSSPFSALDKLSCYISNDFVDAEFDDGKGRSAWVGLPEKCGKLIADNFVKQSIDGGTPPAQEPPHPPDLPPQVPRESEPHKPNR